MPRRAPNIPPKDVPGQTKVGMDGHMYTSRTNKVNVYRWFKVPNAESTRKVPAGKASDFKNTKEVGMDGMLYESKQKTKKDPFRWYKVYRRDDLHTDVRTILDNHWPTSIQSYDDYKAYKSQNKGYKRQTSHGTYCRLSKNLQCTKGHGTGRDFCKASLTENDGYRCVIDQDYDFAADRVRGRRDPHFLQQRQWDMMERS